MKGRFAFLLLGTISCNAYGAEFLDLDAALRNTYRACVDIDDNLHDLKVLAGVNTAVTSVGSALGVGALAVGLTKAELDKRIESLYDDMVSINYSYQGDGQELATKAEFAGNVNTQINNINFAVTKDYQKFVEAIKQAQQTQTAPENEMVKKSKKLGNWRTGLLAGNTATNIAGAVIASKTVNKNDISTQINTCVSAVQDLRNAILSAKLNGLDVTEADQIYDACSEYEFVDVDAIAKRGRGAMVSSAVGAGLGGVGTATSISANSKKIREDDTESGKKKEKNLNTASNVLSAGAAAASVTATVFNARQISAIKKVAQVSEKCTALLK